MNLKKIISIVIGAGVFMIVAGVAVIYYMNATLPDMITLKDYENATPQVSEVYDRSGKKIGEFFREKRILLPLNEIPEVVRQAFLSAEDSGFYQHGGINYFAIARAILANLRAGEKVQGASTITQQVARSILLSREKTYTRKIKEVLLSYKMENNLSKDEILYLYLNHIYLGQQAYGVAVASEVYFNKPIKDITLPEAAILAGLPKAPSAYAPLRNPSRAKERQIYVLSRMRDDGLITDEQMTAAVEMPLKVFERKSFWDKAPHFLETVRQLLIEKLGEEMVLDKGLRIYTSLDLEKQTVAQDEVQNGLRELDKRQGYRSTLGKLDNSQEVAKFLLDERNRLIDAQKPFRVLQPDGSLPDWGPLNLTGYAMVDPNAPTNDPTNAPVNDTKNDSAKKISTDEKIKLPPAPDYAPIGTYTKGVVTQVDDQWGLVYVRFAEGKGLIDLENMGWARNPDPTKNVRWLEDIKKPSEALSQGDLIELKVIGKKFFSTRINDQLKELKQKQKKDYQRPESLPDFDDYCELQLEQTPVAQAALLAIDQRTNEIISMVGGYEFSSKNQLNRSIQSLRQTGSSFKPFVYLAALDKGFTPSSLILDAPIVYEEEQEVEGSDDQEVITKKWKPTNHSNKFRGDILFRNALIQSLNVPSVKIIEKIGVNWAADYARRLGIFSPLNMDFTLALGSSSVTLYEMVRSFSEFGKMGQKVVPIFIHKVEDREGNVILQETSLDERFKRDIGNLDEYYRRRRVNYMAWRKSQETGTPFVAPYPYGNQTADATTADAATTDQANAEATTTPTDTPTPTPDVGKSSDSKNPDEFVYTGPALPDPAKEPPFYEGKPEQLIKPETAYILTSLLRGVTEEEGGTGRRAATLGRPVAGKTGTTSNYYDAWFMGYTMDIATGVWVGFDEEKTLGRGEVGGRAALPIWVEYMKAAHGDLPPRDFPIPEGIVFASIDNETGRLASANSKEVVRQAFVDGTEPKEIQDDPSSQSTETQNFFKEDLSE